MKFIRVSIKIMIKFLSYTINEHTPTYGNKNNFKIFKNKSIVNNDNANESIITMTSHIGTHLDMPYHFYENGQCICDFNDDFWYFEKIKIIEINPKGLVIDNELLEKIKPSDCEILIVKTGACHNRSLDLYWEENYGFSPEVYEVLIEKMPNLRVFGFDTISISSFKHRDIGKSAHRKFLNPKRPVLLLEDMDLNDICEDSKISKIIVAPFRIEKCDGIPCCVVGITDD